ncbi:MAG: ABC transporter permease subunit [Anaerolineae bacterium]|nr:ABC transporter permease subunit [Anaerolineae bacterium]
MPNIGRSFHNLWTVFKHEFSVYFISPIIYWIGAGWLCLAGVFYSNSLGFYNQGTYEVSMSSLFSPMAFLTIFIAPALTMRLLAEEVHAGTHELLFTAPVRDWEVVVGKWLASWAVMSSFILVTFLHAGLLIWRGSPNIAVMITGYIGLWLVCGATLAIGVFASSLSQYQLVSFMISMGTLVLLWVAGAVSSLISNSLLSEAINQLTITNHYHNTMLNLGLVDPIDVAYFVGVMALFLFLATQILGTRRWRA